MTKDKTVFARMKVKELKKELALLDKAYGTESRRARLNKIKRPEIPRPEEVTITPNRVFFSGWVYERSPVLLRKHLSLLFVSSFSAALLPFILISHGWTIHLGSEDLSTTLVLGVVIPFFVGLVSWVLNLRYCRLCGSDYYDINPTAMVCTNCMQAYAPLFDDRKIGDEIRAMYLNARNREDEERRIVESVKRCRVCEEPVKWSPDIADYQCPKHGNQKMQDICSMKANRLRMLRLYQDLICGTQQ